MILHRSQQLVRGHEKGSTPRFEDQLALIDSSSHIRLVQVYQVMQGVEHRQDEGPNHSVDRNLLPWLQLLP
jgi:hypothetical protein